MAQHTHSESALRTRLACVTVDVFTVIHRMLHLRATEDGSRTRHRMTAQCSLIKLQPVAPTLATTAMLYSGTSPVRAALGLPLTRETLTSEVVCYMLACAMVLNSRMFLLWVSVACTHTHVEQFKVKSLCMSPYQSHIAD